MQFELRYNSNMKTSTKYAGTPVESALRRWFQVVGDKLKGEYPNDASAQKDIDSARDEVMAEMKKIEDAS